MTDTHLTVAVGNDNLHVMSLHRLLQVADSSLDIFIHANIKHTTDNPEHLTPLLLFHNGKPHQNRIPLVSISPTQRIVLKTEETLTRDLSQSCDLRKIPSNGAAVLAALKIRSINLDCVLF